MSVPHPADPPAPVRLAFLIATVGCPLVAVAEAVAGVAALRHLSGAAPAFLAAADDATLARQTLTRLRFELDVDVIAAAVTALAMSPIGVWLRRPARSARVAAWIAAAVLCPVLACGAAVSPELYVASTGVESSAYRRAAANLLAGWYQYLYPVLITLAVLAMLSVAGLLMTGASADFYRLRHQDGRPGLWTVAARLPKT